MLSLPPTTEAKREVREPTLAAILELVMELVMELDLVVWGVGVGGGNGTEGVTGCGIGSLWCAALVPGVGMEVTGGESWDPLLLV